MRRRARQAAHDFATRVAALRARYRERPMVRVFYQVWDRPPITVNGEHIISDVIRLCGGQNLFADLTPLAPTLSQEAVVAADTEIIISGAANDPDPAQQTLALWRRFPSMTAVRRGHLFWVPTDLIHRHTPRILDGAERICRALEGVRGARPWRRRVKPSR